jgi:AcrR family transcriptional regulator
VVRLCRYTVAQETDCGPIKKMSTLVNFQELPVIGTDPPERADAARNRRRILAAAEKLFAENGVSCTSMDAIAAEAGVGKGTLFRRFGDRASLARAVISEHESKLQDALIRGEPPLGPGAPPLERLTAFGSAYVDFLERHAQLLMAAEGSYEAYLHSSPYAFYRTHVGMLLREGGLGDRADYLADVVLAPLSATAFTYLRDARQLSCSELTNAHADLCARLLDSSR